MSRWLRCLCALGLAACAPRSTSKDPARDGAGKGSTMTAQGPAAGACAPASAAVQATLDQHRIDSFGSGGAGRQALERLAVTPEALVAIGLDASCPNAVRFAAFEGWIGLRGEAALGEVDDATAAAMAAVQAEAIRRADDASAWSLPPDVTASAISRHLIALGRRVLPQLQPLLDDHRELPIEGSETAAVASLRGYRVSDLAAGLIAVIVGEDYLDGKSAAERDPQLAALRALR